MRHVLPHRGLPLLVTTALTAIAAVLTTWPLARDMGRVTVSTGEVLLSAWQLNWYHQALLTNPLAWADANIFFPYGNAATFNDLLLTHGLVTLLVAWAESPVLALNLALLGGIVLCGLFAHLLIDELVDEPWAATIGGTLFALAPFRFLHVGHLSISAAWAVPLFFWTLLRHLREPSWGRAVLAAVCGVAVGLSSLYHAAYVVPVLPLVVLFGARRGPSGRRVWLPLVVAGLSGVALLAWFLTPFASTMRDFGAAAEPDALLKYGADLSSLGRKPAVMGEAGGTPGLNPEAHLYPGAALSMLAVAGAILAVGSVRTLHGWGQRVAVAILSVCGASVLGLLLPQPGPARGAAELGALTLVWVGPVAAMVWAIAVTDRRVPVGPALALRLGVAGTVLSFVLALGTEARHLGRAIGPAPYWLLAQASSAFEGVRVPARFGGILMLFLALVAAGTLAALARREARWSRLAALGLGSLAIVACVAELPLPPLPQGRWLVPLPELDHPVYRWIRDQPGRSAILELPDWPSGGSQHWERRSYRALRYMLASKQHGKPLVNGVGRVRPFFWQRFRRIEPWSDPFFTFIAAYFPISHVLVHEAGIPVAERDAVWARLNQDTDGWRPVFHSQGVRVYALDRSFGRGTYLDRLFLRREIAPRAEVVFSARVAPEARPTAEAGDQASTTLDLLRDRHPVGAWELGAGWREFRVTVPIDAVASDIERGWPRAGVLLRWKTQGNPGAAFEIRGLSVERVREPRH
jgi:hypothetical protein